MAIMPSVLSLSEPKDHAGGAGPGHARRVGFGHGGRPQVGHRLDGGRLVQPPVAAVGVEEGDRLLHVAAHIVGQHGLDEVGRHLAPDPVVLGPRPGHGHAGGGGDVGGHVAHRVMADHRPVDGVTVEQVDRHRVRAQVAQQRLSCCGTRHRTDVVAGTDEEANGPATDHAGGAGDEHLHRRRPDRRRPHRRRRDGPGPDRRRSRHGRPPGSGPGACGAMSGTPRW